MIRKEELRIGNLLGFQETDYVNICSIHSDDTIRHTINSKEYGCFRLNQYQPILLTEEILLKCGFEQDVNIFISNDFVVFKNVHGVADGIDKESFYCAYWKYAKHIKHLHQLQNLYFALTGKELTYTP